MWNGDKIHTRSGESKKLKAKMGGKIMIQKNWARLWTIFGSLLIIILAGSNVSALMNPSIAILDNAGLPYDGISYPVGDTLLLNGTISPSAGEVASVWRWEIVGPVVNSSNSQNYTQPMNNPGTYTITLKVTSSTGLQESVSDTVVISDDRNEWGLNADFIYAVDRTDPLMVSLIDQSQFGTGTVGSSVGELITHWYWVLDGKLVSTNPNPSEVSLPVAMASGTHVLGLRIDTNLGKKSYIEKTIVINPDPVTMPTAAFSADKTRVSAGEQVAFTDQSINLPTSWMWDFGDGQKSYLQSPIHTYTAPGKYTVSLTVSNQKGVDDEIKVEYITVTNPPPMITANASIYLGEHPLEVQFNASATVGNMDVKSSQALIKGWLWEFYDEVSGTRGVFSHEQNPLYVFEWPGIYWVNVTCFLYDGGSYKGTIDLVRNSESPRSIRVTPLPMASYYWYYLDDEDTCCYLVKFTDTSINASSWVWDFDDGSKPSNEQNPTHRYKEAGNYKVMLTVANNQSITNSTIMFVPISTGYDQPRNPRSYDQIIAAFTTGVSANGKTVNFIDRSIGEVTQWNWDFGDGSKDIITNPADKHRVHTYQRYGEYTVTLTASNPLYENSCSHTIFV